MSHDVNNTMNDEPRINDLLESFRPGVDDLAAETWDKLRAPLAEDAALQQRAESIHRADRAVRSAMHDTPLPAGLMERILASLPADNAISEIVVAAPPADIDAATLPTPAEKTFGLSRRAWAFTGAAALSLAIGVLAFNFWRRGPSDIGDFTQEDLVRLVGDWENDPALVKSNMWQPVPASGMLKSHPLNGADFVAPAIRVIGPVQIDGRSLVVYQLTRGTTTARLYVAHTHSTFAVPRTPQSLLRGLTAQRDAIAWQRGEYLFVVVVDRDAPVTNFVRIRDQA